MTGQNGSSGCLDTAQVEMQVLGRIGKILTGPWMKDFYSSSVNQIDPLEEISYSKRLKKSEGATGLSTRYANTLY